MKEKSKYNPFINTLHSDEEILWFHVPQADSWRVYRTLMLRLYIRYVVPAAFLLAMFTMWGWLIIPKSNPPQFGDVLSVLAFSLAMTTLISLPLLAIGQLVVLLNQQQMTHSAYAVTNQRLLRYVAGRITATPLEKASAFASEGHLFIEKPFRVWYDIPEPEEAVEIIHEAQMKLKDKRQR
jgi:hypothetical protein